MDMRIDDLMNELKQLRKRHGNVKVTCTHSTLPDQNGQPLPDVFETTVGHLVYQNNERFGPHIRVCL